MNGTFVLDLGFGPEEKTYVAEFGNRAAPEIVPGARVRVRGGAEVYEVLGTRGGDQGHIWPVCRNTDTGEVRELALSGLHLADRLERHLEVRTASDFEARQMARYRPDCEALGWTLLGVSAGAFGYVLLVDGKRRLRTPDALENDLGWPQPKTGGTRFFLDEDGNPVPVQGARERATRSVPVPEEQLG